MSGMGFFLLCTIILLISRLYTYKSAFSKPLRVIALCLVYAFLLEQVVQAAPGVIKPLNLSFFERPPVVLKIPESVALIEDFYKAPKSDRTIILIQDAHTNTSGQINVSKTLDHILKNKEDLKYIFLEAGYQDESLNFVRRLVPLEKRKRVGLSFLRKGKLQGSEYFNLTKERDVFLYGVEDPKLYQRAWGSYKYIAQKRNKFQTYINKIESTIKTLKPKIYNPRLFPILTACQLKRILLVLR